MEGPKSFAEKPQRVEADESAESIAESIERAQELMAELKTFDGVEVIGGDAMALNNRAEELSAELTAVLKQIPANDCIKNGLPYHPTDIKQEALVTPLPAQPDYPHDYEPIASGDYPAMDDEKAA